MDQLTASEAIYGFCGWLTTRPEPVVMSDHHDAAPIPPLIEEFCRVNELSFPRPDYHLRLTHPPAEGGTDHD